jgi:hypothetical protein
LLGKNGPAVYDTFFVKSTLEKCADLPEDIRDDWMQWHHEQLVRDNKVFEREQLKIDI